MLIGQLFYFEKELSKLGTHAGVEDFLNIEIATISKNELISLKGDSSSMEFSSKLKELFIQNYLNLLTQNQLYSALNFWKLLTSALKVDLSISTNSDFQRELLDWIDDGCELSDLKHRVLGIGSRTSNEQDFALYYGLHVLYKIYLVSSSSDTETSQLNLSVESQTTAIEFNNLPEILIIASTSIKPFVENLDCIFIDNSSLKDDIANQVSVNLSEFESIKLLIIDSQDLDLLHKIKKVNTKNVLVTQLNFSSSQEDNFFDVLVKQTLGINLS